MKLKKINDFYDLILDEQDSNLIKSYLLEFISEYIQYKKEYLPFGTNISFTNSILATNEKLIRSDTLREYNTQLIELNFQIKDKLTELENILSGFTASSNREIKVLFPLLEECEKFDEYPAIGAIDSLTIKVGKGRGEDHFIVVPSGDELDTKLHYQIKLTWNKAKEYCAKYLKNMNAFHEVIINFDERLGNYKGDSVGTTILIGFIQEILKFYNAQIILRPICDVAFSGGVNSNGTINRITKEITEKKVEVVFFSNCSTLVVPKVDEQAAIKKLEELNQEFPERNLKLIAVKDIDEILARRDLIEISKQKFTARAGKFVKKNWVRAVVTVLLAILFAFLFVMDFDNNPAILTTDGGILFVKNKNGKILWTKKVGLLKNANTIKRILDVNSRIFDTDNDGKNEVLFSGGLFLGDKIITQKLFCFDYKGNTRWIKSFTDKVESEREKLDVNYSIAIIDTLTFTERKSLFLISANSNSFSSAIYRVDLETGARLPGTMWCSGFVVDAMIKDIDNDGNKDILAVGVDNGFEEIVIFSYEIDTLTRVRFSTKEYLIRNFPTAELKNYIRLPKTDYDNYLQMRIPGIERGTLNDKILEKKYMFATTTNEDERMCHLWINLDYNLKDFDVIVDNEYRVIRDSLVAKGKLNPPYTDTREWIELYKSKILYWHNGKWVKREELE
ncbi:MAG: hypothetical protein HXY50_10635 [Ignavibacteriaceae bacterium]|nr:hypothetical protein [Ignavibacteriaceae bacterium]